MTPRERRARQAFFVVAAYLVLATLANAIALGFGFSDHVLERRAFDYGWELGLPWRAGHGQWVGRDFSYPMGPLWQLFGWLGSGGGALGAARTVAGLHAVFPLASIALSAAAAVLLFRAWPQRLAAFAGVALFALHDDVRTLRSLVSLLVVLAYPADDGGGRRAELSGVLVALGMLLSFETGILGVGSLLAMAVAEALARRDVRAALRRLGRAAAALVVTELVLGGAWALVGGSWLSALRGFVEVSRAYAVIMVEGRHGLSLAPVVGFAVLGVGLLPYLLRKDAVAATWLAGTVPLLARALIRSDAEHVYASLGPLASVLLLVSVRSFGRRPALSVYAGLLSLMFALGWFGSRRETPTAWRPGGFVDALHAVRGRLVRAQLRGDLSRGVDFARHVRAEGGCLVVPERFTAIHPVADVPGPTATVLRWTPTMKRELARREEELRCPWAIRQIVSFDFPAPWNSIGFGADFVTQSELYEPSVRIGPALFGARLRPRPLRAKVTDVFVLDLGSPATVLVPGSLELRLPRAIPADHLLAIDYTLKVSRLNALTGGTPPVEVAFFRGPTPVGPAMVMPDVDVNRRVRAIVPVHAEIAEWRWVAGRAPRRSLSADRMVISLAKRTLSPAAVSLTVHSVQELSPPPAREPGSGRVASLDLIEAARQGRFFPRATLARVEGDSLELSPNAPGDALAEVFFPIHPDQDSCLLAELASDPAPESDGTRFEVHVIDGASRPMRLDWHIEPGGRRLVELPLRDFADRDVMLRIGTWAEDNARGDRAFVRRARIAPCPSPYGLLHAFADGRAQIVRGQSWVNGDVVRIVPAVHAEPPTEIRLPLHFEKGTCLAMALRAEGEADATPVAVEVGVLTRRVHVRLMREVLRPGPGADFRDVSLDEFAGRDVSLRFASWSVEGKSSLRGLVVRPRLHRCGDGAPWPAAWGP